MPYNDLWRRERKLLHQLTQPRAAASYESIQLQESAHLCLDILNKPEEHWSHSQRFYPIYRSLNLPATYCFRFRDALVKKKRYAGSTVLQIAFGRRALSNSDPAITQMRACNEKMVKTAVPGAYLVDSIPFLDYLPDYLAPWKRYGSNLYVSTFELFERLYEGAKDVGECFVKRIEELRSSHGLNDHQAIFLAGAMVCFLFQIL